MPQLSWNPLCSHGGPPRTFGGNPRQLTIDFLNNFFSVSLREREREWQFHSFVAIYVKVTSSIMPRNGDPTTYYRICSDIPVQAPIGRPYFSQNVYFYWILFTTGIRPECDCQASRTQINSYPSRTQIQSCTLTLLFNELLLIKYIRFVNKMKVGITWRNSLTWRPLRNATVTDI